MTNRGYIAVFCLVCIVHVIILRAHFENKIPQVKQKAKVCRVSLSRVVVKKPPPPVIPQPAFAEPLKPPDLQPVKKVKKEYHKPKRKKIVKREKVIKKRERRREFTEKKASVKKPEPVVEKVKKSVVKKSTGIIRDLYLNEIRKQIRQKLIYPKIAKRMHMEGEVDISFIVYKDGRISDIKIVKSSRKIFSNYAIKTIKSLVLKPIPKALEINDLKLEVPIEFKLTKG